jgi:hypothetical protein
MKMVTRNPRKRILLKSQGAVTIFEMIPLILMIWGIIVGAKFGFRFGYFGAWIFGIVGGIVGLFSWWFLIFVLSKWLDRDGNLNKKTTEQLCERLHDPGCKNPNLVLLELGIRGEKMENYLPVVLGLLVSPLVETRKRGWQTLISVFPQQAKMITDYHYGDPIERCREKVQKLTPILL